MQALQDINLDTTHYFGLFDYNKYKDYIISSYQLIKHIVKLVVVLSKMIF